MRATGPITRRGFLHGLLGVTGVAGVSLAAGCDLFSSGDPAEPATNPLDGFLRETIALADRYDLAVAQVPPLGALINSIWDNHREHARTLAQAINAPAPASPAAPSAAPRQDRATVLAALVAAESKARDAANEACLAANSRFAPLLGSIAAARATHLEILR